MFTDGLQTLGNVLSKDKKELSLKELIVSAINIRNITVEVDRYPV